MDKPERHPLDDPDTRICWRLPNGGYFWGTKEQLEIVLANIKKMEEKRKAAEKPAEKP